MLTYDVILLSWKRPQNLPGCVAAAKRQSVPPHQVVVWHNDPSTEAVDFAVNVHCDENLGCRPRHAIGQLSTADVCVFADDDVLLFDPQVCAALLAAVARHPDSVVGVAGRRITKIGGNVYGDGAVECAPWKPERAAGLAGEHGDQPVSVVKGKVHAVRRSLLHLAFRHDLPPDVAGEDDIALNAELQMESGAPSWLAGGVWHGRVRDIPDPDRVGNEFRKDHFERRSATCRHMIELGWDPLLWQGYDTK